MIYFNKNETHSLVWGERKWCLPTLSDLHKKASENLQNKNFSNTKQQLASFLDNSLHNAVPILPSGFQRQRC